MEEELARAFAQIMADNTVNKKLLIAVYCKVLDKAPGVISDEVNEEAKALRLKFFEKLKSL